MTRRARILLALGEEEGLRAAASLESAGLTVRGRSPRGALTHDLSTFRPDLVIIDLPAGDPAALAATLRRTHAAFNPLVLCTVDGPTQWVPALEAGADAHLEKPYTARELLASVRALLRRAPWLERSVHQVGGLVIDEDAHAVHYGQQEILLGKKEFGILALLARHRGVIVSKRTLLDELWGYEAYDENLVEVQVCALRRRLPPEAARTIQTVRGVGYVLRTAALAEAAHTA